MSNFDEHWQNPQLRENLLEIIRALEEEPSLIGMSGHFMAVVN